METLWSDTEFFYNRTQADDIPNSLKEIVNLRRFLDILFSEPGINPEKTLLTGHDFGGMYGIVTGAFDNRIHNYVIMAATPRFSDWYLYSPETDSEEKKEFIKEFSFLDPVNHVCKLNHKALLFQFGKTDPHVPQERAEELCSAVHSREILWYSTGHGLCREAEQDRFNWYCRHLFTSQD